MVGQMNSMSQGFRLSEPLRSFASTVRRVLLEPVAFFRNMDRTDSLWNPIVFVMVCDLASFLLTYLVAPLDPFAGESEGFGGLLAWIGDRSLASVAVLVLSALVLAPLFVVLGLYFGAAIYHILVGVFAEGTNAGFDATLRVYAYTGAVGLLSWIPVLGYAAILYGFFLAFLGFREVHNTTTGRALGVILVPLLFWISVTVGSEVLFRLG